MLSPEQTERLFKTVDQDQNGFWCYEEVLATCVQDKLINKEDRLWQAFCLLDVNKDGRLSPGLLNNPDIPDSPDNPECNWHLS